MASEDEWKRRREREKELEEREKEDREEAEKRQKQNIPGKQSAFHGGLPTEKLDEYIQRATVLIEQLNSLYHMYITGIEKLPPLEKRNQLDQIMVALTSAPKPTPSLLFKCNNIISTYSTHKERWDKMMKDLENGKLKRSIGSGAKR